MAKVTAPGDGLAVRLAALAAGPVEAHIGRAAARVPREHGLRQRAADEETLAIIVTLVGRPALLLGVVEESGVVSRGVLPSRPPDVGDSGVQAG